MPPKPSAQTLRSLMSQVAGEEATKERMREIAERALNVNFMVPVVCPHCHESFKTSVPNTGVELKNAVMLTEQLEGKAGDQPPGSTTVIIQRPAR